MPVMSSTMTEGKVVAWLKQVGDFVKANENIAVVESDKSDMEAECFHDGYLAAILVPAGGQAPTGQPIALIAETVEEMHQVQQNPQQYLAQLQTQPQTAKPPVNPEPELVTANPTTNGRVIASPRAKKLAQTYHLDLTQIKGSGPYGRIVAEDVLQIASPPSRPTPPAPAVVIPASPPPVTATGSGTITPLSTLQQAVVRNMVASLAVPVFRVTYAITTNALDTLYQQIKGFRLAGLFFPPHLGHHAIGTVFVAPINHIHPGGHPTVPTGLGDVFQNINRFGRHHLLSLFHLRQNIPQAVGILGSHHRIQLRHPAQ